MIQQTTTADVTPAGVSKLEQSRDVNILLMIFSINNIGSK